MPMHTFGLQFYNCIKDSLNNNFISEISLQRFHFVPANLITCFKVAQTIVNRGNNVQFSQKLIEHFWKLPKNHHDLRMKLTSGIRWHCGLLICQP